MTMSSPVRPEALTLAQPIPVPTLTVLPPSSDTDSWSRSPSPRPSRSGRLNRSHRSRTRTKRRNEDEQGCTPKLQWGKTPQIVIEESVQRDAAPHRSPSPSPSLAAQMEGEEGGQDSPSYDLLLPPPRSGSRSPSPSRRSRWSLRSLLSRDSDWDSCRSVEQRQQRTLHLQDHMIGPMLITNSKGQHRHTHTKKKKTLQNYINRK